MSKSFAKPFVDRKRAEVVLDFFVNAQKGRKYVTMAIHFVVNIVNVLPAKRTHN